MKATGIVRSIRDVGRIVIPQELRKTMDLKLDDCVEFYTDGDKIIIQKYAPGCIFCEGLENLVIFNGKPICKNCIEKLQK